MICARVLRKVVVVVVVLICFVLLYFFALVVSPVCHAWFSVPRRNRWILRKTPLRIIRNTESSLLCKRKATKQHGPTDSVAMIPFPLVLDGPPPTPEELRLVVQNQEDWARVTKQKQRPGPGLPLYQRLQTSPFKNTSGCPWP